MAGRRSAPPRHGPVKTHRIRSKPCDRCGDEARALFRARVAKNGDWVFLCEPCLMRAKDGNQHYQYGGTWKARKRN